MPHPIEYLIRKSSVSVASWLFMTAFVLAGCDGPTATGPPDPAAGPTPCAPGELLLADGTCHPIGLPAEMPCPPGELLLEDGITCQPPGLPADMPCPPGEMLLKNGTCQKAGVPASSCGLGFLPDGKDGCESTLPADSCPEGLMAIPGDTECHEVAPCGSGTWGDIPLEANTHFVDKAYAGGNSDGTQAKPWTTIQQGVDAAAPGAIVAVAAGVYPEDVLIQGKAVRLWGRCPAMVEVVGTGAKLGAILVLQEAAGGAEIRGVAATGPTFGIGVSGASDVVIARVWIHDAGYAGVNIQDDLGPTSVVMKIALLERNHNAGVLVVGSEATIQATVVRSSLPGAQGPGHGIEINGSNARANVMIFACLVEQNRSAGVTVSGSDAAIEVTVVRSTLLNEQGKLGRGINVQDDASVTVLECLIEQNHSAGLYVSGSEATVETTMIRSTLPDALGEGGRGVIVREHANVTVRACLVEGNQETGVFVLGSDAVIELTVVRSALSDGKGELGRGIEIDDDSVTNARANVIVHASLIEQNHDMGVYVSGSDATIEATVVRSTLPNAAGEAGRGINIQSDQDTMERSNAAIRASLIEQNHDIGVYVSVSDAEISDTIVRDTAPQKSDAKFGDGIVVLKGAVTIQNVDVTRNARAGVASLGGQVVVTGGVFTCNGFDIEGEPVDNIPFTFDGSTGWQCSAKAPAECTELGACHVETAGIEAPSELPPVDPLPPADPPQP